MDEETTGPSGGFSEESVEPKDDLGQASALTGTPHGETEVRDVVFDGAEVRS